MTTGARVLPCPECRDWHRKNETHTNAAIGDRRWKCKTCNRFYQAVRRQVAARLADEFPEREAEIRASVEADLYPQILESYDPLAIQQEKQKKAALDRQIARARAS